MALEIKECQGKCPNFIGKCVAQELTQNIDQAPHQFCYKNKVELDEERLLYAGVHGAMSKKEYDKGVSGFPYPEEATLPFNRTHIVIAGDIVVEGDSAYFIQYPLTDISKVEAIKFYDGSKEVGYINVEEASSGKVLGELIPINGVSNEIVSNNNRLNILPLLKILRSKLQ